MDRSTLFSSVPGKETSVGSTRVGGADGEKKNLRRLIVFILGGITHSECRVTQEVASSYKTCDIIVGGSKILTPNDFVNDLRDLSKQDSERRQSFDPIEEEKPLLENNVGHSHTLLPEDGNACISACERHLIQGGRYISEWFGACTSSICGN